MKHAHTPLISRRALCSASLSALWLTGCAAPSVATRPTALKIGALFAGKRDDRGFMEAGWRGLEQARLELGVETAFIDSIQPQRAALVAALEQLARDGAQLVIAHGGQNNEACEEVARRFPDTRFVVTQGAVSGPNLASYEVLQEESAYLAGMLAALTTRTGVVGHMSGIRVRPGLKGAGGLRGRRARCEPLGALADQLFRSAGRQRAVVQGRHGPGGTGRRCDFHHAQCRP